MYPDWDALIGPPAFDIKITGGNGVKGKCKREGR